MKQFPGHLALLGGPPAFADSLPVGRPNVGSPRAFLSRASEILASGWLTNNGPCVQQFEQRLRQWTGARHCLAVSNATAGLSLAARAADLSGEVIVPGFTFAATAHALQWIGVTPVFCDVDPRTHNLDPDRVEKLIGPKTSGIVAVHLWGRPAPIDALSKIARDHGLRLIFDAAHAFGCSCNGRPVGNFGDAEVFSFHATKFLNAFEGGAVVTNNDDIARRVMLMRSFGLDGEEGEMLGINAKMPEVCAAMGLTNLDCAGEFIRVNRRNYDCYRQALADVPGIRMVCYDASERCNFQYIVMEIEDTAGLSRDELLEILRAENIGARRYFHPGCHRIEPYCSNGSPARRLPVTERLARQVLALPTGTSVTPGDIKVIAGILQLCIENAKWIRQRLQQPEMRPEVFA